jgi:hypothetical protein
VQGVWTALETRRTFRLHSPARLSAGNANGWRNGGYCSVGALKCQENGFYITTTQQVSGVGFDGNGDLSVYGADGNLFSPDGSAYNAVQSVTVSANGDSIFSGLPDIYSPGFQYATSMPSLTNLAPNNGQSYSYFNQWLKSLKSCFVDVGLKTLAEDISPLPVDTPGPSDMGDLAGGALNSLSNQRMIAAYGYAASKGLPYAAKSSIFRGIVSQASLLAKTADAIPIAVLYYGIGDAYVREWQQCGW